MPSNTMRVLYSSPFCFSMSIKTMSLLALLVKKKAHIMMDIILFSIKKEKFESVWQKVYWLSMMNACIAIRIKKSWSMAQI